MKIGQLFKPRFSPMKRNSVGSSKCGRILPAANSYQSSRSRYLRAFASARAMRFWRPRVAVKELTVSAVFAAALALAPLAVHAQFPASLDLSTLNGADGFAINGFLSNVFTGGDISGTSVSNAGDVNGDGIDDVIIGAPNSLFLSDRDQSYVVFGNNSGFSSSLDLSALDGTNGFAIIGIDTNDGTGRSVSGAGDVNGDGIDDVIIGAPFVGGYGGRGKSYVVYGNNSGFSSSLDLSALDGTNGFVINGITRPDSSGRSVSGAGDINGDGVDDLIIGAPIFDPAQDFFPYGGPPGESYVVLGNNSGFSSALNLSTLNGENGFVISGISSDDRSGFSVSGAGDVNGDGIDDVIIGAHLADPNFDRNAGESYVVFGNNSGFSSSLDLSALDGTNGFVINGVDRDDSSGRTVSGAGDVNGDGIDDLIIGAWRADPIGLLNAGESYVVFGSNSGFSSPFDLSTLDGTNGFAIRGIDPSGFLVSGAGDFNGDGIDDLIIGAYDRKNGNFSAGDSYVLFGRPATPGVLKGDVNMDGDIGFSDIGPFIAVLESGVFQAEADCDCSAVVDFFDIAPFIVLLQQ